MPKKKRESSKQTSVRVGNMSDISGNVNVAGGNITTHHTTTGLSAAEIKQLFDQIYTNIEARPQTSLADKEDLKAEVKEIQITITEATQKNKQVDQGFLARRFRNIARMAPDVLDVIVATLANPLAGLGAIVKKIAQKAKSETSTP
jgi:cell division septum initiation protein DivIVA